MGDTLDPSTSDDNTVLPGNGMDIASGDSTLESESSTSVSTSAKRGRISLVRYVGLGLLGASIIASIFVFLEQTPKNQSSVNARLSSSAEQRFNVQTIPSSSLSGLSTSTSIASSPKLSINGKLQANNSVVITPTSQPTNAVAGQVYYDKSTNQLAYYDGTSFTYLTGSHNTVTSLGGASGVLAVGPGLNQSNNQLTNSGVLSLQGQTGNVTLVGGSGISISGTQFTNTGVLAIGGQVGSISLGNGLDISSGTLKNSGIVSIASGTPSLIVSNDGSGNVTITSNGAGTGTVSGVGGVAGQIAEFTGTQTIADSLLNQSGTTIIDNGSLSVTGSLTLGTALSTNNGGTGATTPSGARTNLGAAASGANSDITSLSGLTTALNVLQGGTGDTTLTANGILLGNGTNPITSLTSASAGLCLISGAGVPSWQSCPGGGGVISINNQTGTVSIADATGSGSVITINNASTSQLGLAEFNSSDFSVSNGVADTIQPINTSASPTFGQLSLTSAQSAAAMAVINNTDTSATGNLISLQLNGVNKFTVGPGGNVVANGTITSGTINGQTVSNAASFTGSLAVAGTANLNGGANITGVLGANTITPTSSLTIGSTGQSFTLQGSSSSTITATGGGFTTNIGFTGSPTGAVTYNFDRSAVAGTYTICTTTGNCAGVGGGVTSSGGTAGSIPVFTGGNAITNSSLTDNGTTVATTEALDVQGGTTIIGVPNVQTGTLQLAYGGANFSASLTPAGLTANRTYTLPDASGTVCLSTGNCLGGSSGGANASLSNLSSVAINTSLLPGATTIDLGSSSTPFRNLFLSGSSASPATSNFSITGTPTAARTLTLPDASGTVCLATSSACGFATGSGTAFLQNGNSFGATANLGTNDNNGLDLITDGAARVTIDGSGNTTFNNNVTLGGSTLSSTGALSVTPGGALTVGATGQTFTLQGNSSSTVTATSGGNTTSLAFVTPTANVTYRLQAASAGIYDLCTTAGNCVGLGGGVTASGATSGTIAAFTGSNAISNSLLSENGSTVAVNGNLNLTSGNVFEINGSQISSTNLSDGSNLAKLNASQTFTGTTNTFSGNVAVNGGALSSSGALSITPGGSLTVGATGQALTLQGNSSSVITSTSGVNTTTLGFQAPTANVTYNLPTATAGTYSICTTTGNCAGVGGGVTTSGGATGTIPVFTGSSGIGNSLLSQSGGTVSANGNLNLASGNNYEINGSQIASSNLSDSSNLAKLNAAQTFTGTDTFQSNSTSAFVIQNSTGYNVFNVDTTNQQISADQNSASTTLPILSVVQNGSSSSTVALQNSTTSSAFYLSDNVSNSNALAINSYTAATTTTATPTFVQQNSTTASGGGTSQALAFSSNNTAGNTIIVAVSWNYTTGIDPTCSDSEGNSYAAIVLETDILNDSQSGICYATNIKAGANTVTVTYGTAANPITTTYRALAIHEYSGITSSNPVDTDAINSTTGATGTNGYTSNAATTSTNGDLIFGYFVDETGSAATATAGTGFQMRTNNNGLTSPASTEDMLQSSAGSVAATQTETAAHRYTGMMMAFRPGSSTGSLTNTNSNAVFSLSQSGQATFRNATNSTTAFQIQNASGAALLNVSATGATTISTTAGTATPNISSQTGSEWDANGNGYDTLPVSPHAVGDLMMFMYDSGGSGNVVTSVSGGGVTNWHYVTGSTNNQYLYEGTITSAGSSSITVTNNGAAPTGWSEMVAQEFSSTYGANTAWNIVTSANQGNPAGVTSVPFPSLTTTAANQLYWGYAGISSSEASSPGGYTVTSTSAGDFTMYNAATAANTAYAPVAGQSSASPGSSSTFAVIMAESPLSISALSVGGSSQIAANSTTAFQVQNSAGSSLLTADTVNNAIVLGADGLTSNVTLRGGVASGTNLTGSNITLQASDGTGSGGSGSIVFQTAAPTGTTVQTDNSADAGTFTSSVSLSYTTGSEPSRFMVAQINSGCGNSVVGMTYDGIGLTRVASYNTPSVDNTGCNAHTEVWDLLSPPSGTYNLVVNYAGAEGTVGVSTFYNVNQTTPIGTVASASGSTSGTQTTSLGVTATSSAQLVYDAIATDEGCQMVGGPSSGQTQLWQYNTCSGLYAGGSSSKPGASGTVNMGWQTTTSDWTDVGFAINPTTSTSGDTLTNSLVIANNGDVGIDNSSPSYTLDVSGSTRLQSVSNSSTAFQVQNAAGSNLINVDTSGSNVNLGTTGSGTLSSTVNVANSTAAAQTVNVGSTYGAGATTIQGGTGGTSIGTGDATGTTGSIFIQSGNSSSGVSGNVSIDTGNGAPQSGTSIYDNTFEGCANNNFENWFNASTSTAENIGGSAHGGSCVFAAIEDSGDGGFWGIGQDAGAPFTVTPGNEIHFSAWVRAATLAQTVYGLVGWENNSGTVNLSTVTDTTTGWTQITGSALVPAGVTGAWFSFGNNGGGNGSSTTYFDDVTATAQAGAPTLNVGSSNAQSINIGNGDQTWATTIQGGSGGITLSTTNSGNITLTTGTSGSGVIVQTSANSTTAFEIQNASGATGILFQADTINSVITVEGTSSTFASLTLTNAHFTSTQTTAPTAGTPSTCGTGPTGAVTSGSTDSAGSFTLTSGSTTTTATCTIVITFNKTYGTAPKSVVVTGASTAASKMTPAVTATSPTTFTVVLPQTDAVSTAYQFYYWVVK